MSGDLYNEKLIYKGYIKTDEYLAHHGVLGMKWGIRKDGKPQGWNNGKSKKTVFVSGSSKTQTKDNIYYRKELPIEVRKKLNGYMENGNKIIVGDAPGIDRQVQDYLNKAKYHNVEVYGPGSKVRYTANKHWKTNPVDSSEFEEGSKEWLAKKDIEMTKNADEGFAIILDEGSTATRNNVKRLIEESKDVKIFELNKRGSDFDKWVKHL